jgi:predicted permease
MAMRITFRLISLCRNVFRRGRVERDLDEEMRATLDALTVDKMRAGLPREAAQRAARIELGGVEVVKQQVRDARSGALLDTFAQDVRYGVRLLRRYPLFALTAALSLAVGIGATTAVVTIANGLLRFSPPGVIEPERVVDIGRSLDGLPVGFNPGSYPDYLDIRQRTTTLDHVYAHVLFPQNLSLVGPAGTDRVVAEVVTTNYFATLGARPAAGRLFLADESDRPGESPIVVLSHRYWTRRFNADPAIVGQTVRLNRNPVTVVGVAAEGFHGTTIVTADVWVPLSMYANADVLDMRRSGWLVMGARLKPGASTAQAAAELDAIDRALRSEYPSQQNSRPFRLLPASPVAGNSAVAAAALMLLMAFATTVLAIACANVAGLLLARASGRAREMALRLAIGAGRLRLIRQLLIETLMLFALGAAVGVLLGRVMTSALVRLLPTLSIPVEISLGLDWRVVAFACGLTFVAALLSGLAPALHASRADVSTVLKSESQGASARFRLRNAFVVAQVALSLLLIIVGSLFTRALQHAGSTDVGFDASRVQIASIDVTAAGYTDVTGPGAVQALLESVRQVPGVESASLARVLPLASESLGFGLSLPGAVAATGRSAMIGASGNIVASGYLTVMRIPLIAGRDFGEQDAPGAPLVAIVGESTASRFWPGQDPIGKQLAVDGPGQGTSVVQIVGVARNYLSSSLDFGTTPFIYLPFRQHYVTGMALVVRTSPGRSSAAQVRAVAAETNPTLPALTIRPLEEAIAVGLTPQRIVASVAGSLGIVGVLLAAIGIYGITAYMVARRTREIAIRAALGAQRRAIVALVLRHAITLLTIGSVTGLALGAVAGQVLSALLVGVSPLDPAALLAGVGLCAAIVLAGSYLPVYRAIRIQASDALRSE